MVNQSEYEAKLIKACEEWNVILKRTKGTTARGIDSPSVSSQQHVMWVFCFFPITLKIKCKRRGAKKNNTDKQTEGKRKEKENVDVGLHSKLLLPEALCCATFIWSCTSKKKKKKAHHIHRWLPNPRQMSKGLTWQPEHLWKRAQHGEHDGFTDGYMCREMTGKPSQMSLYRFIFTDKTICVCVCECVC